MASTMSHMFYSAHRHKRTKQKICSNVLESRIADKTKGVFISRQRLNEEQQHTQKFFKQWIMILLLLLLLVEFILPDDHNVATI